MIQLISPPRLFLRVPSNEPLGSDSWPTPCWALSSSSISEPGRVPALIDRLRRVFTPSPIDSATSCSLAARRSLTGRRPRRAPVSRSGGGVSGPGGPPAASGTSGCCCSCWGNQERRSVPLWRCWSRHRRRLQEEQTPIRQALERPRPEEDGKKVEEACLRGGWR